MNWETGAAYTAIKDHSSIDTHRDPEEGMERDHFSYTENTKALYLSVDKQIEPHWFFKIGLRYEYTDIEGYSITQDSLNKTSYAYLFPSVHIARNSSSGHSFSLSYAMRIERPLLNDLNPFRYYSTVYSYTSGNAYLLPGLFHTVELKYSNGNRLNGGVYAQYREKGIDYVSIFDDSDRQYTIPQNSFNQHKTGCYLSYQFHPFQGWSLSADGDLYYSESKSYKPELHTKDAYGYGSTLGIQSDWILNSKKTWFAHIGYTHLFPRHEDMFHYKSLVLFDMNLRYSALGGKLNFMLRINDPFNQSYTRSERIYAGYTYRSTLDIHQRNVSLSVNYSFGGPKIKDVYRDSKDTESYRGN